MASSTSSTLRPKSPRPPSHPAPHHASADSSEMKRKLQTAMKVSLWSIALCLTSPSHSIGQTISSQDMWIDILSKKLQASGAHSSSYACCLFHNCFHSSRSNCTHRREVHSLQSTIADLKRQLDETTLESPDRFVQSFKTSSLLNHS